MRFYRQTLLLVCLVSPLAVFAQPVANNDATTVDEDQVVTLNILSNDTPPAGLNAATIDLDTATPAIDNTASTPAGTFTVDLSGVLTYTPVSDFNGAAEITYTIEDMAAVKSGEATVTITVTPVNDAPTVSSIDDVSIAANTSTAAIQFLIADVDNAFSELNVTAESSDNTLIPLVGGIALSGTNSDRTITLTPAPDASGTATITVKVSDGDMDAVETFSIEVTPVVLQPPVISIVGSLTTNEDIPSGTVTITVTDSDSPVGSLQLNATSGNLGLIPAAGISLVPGPPGTWTLSVTPAADQFGATQINLEASDGTNTDTDAVSVSVLPVNDAPTISTIGDQTINKNAVAGPISFTIADPDGFTGVIVKATGNNPSLVAPAGIVLGGANGSRNITVTPLTDAVGTVTMTVTVDDGTESAVEEFLLTVNDPLTPPTITPVPALSTAEDVLSATRSFTVADADTPLSSLQVTAISGNTTLIPNGNITLTPGAGGTYTVQVLPAPNQNGSTTVTLRVFDGTTPVTTPLAVTVTPVNDAPTISTIGDQTINKNAVAGPIPFTIADPDGFTGVIVKAVSNNPSLVTPAGISLGGANGSRNITVTPLTDAVGTVTMTVTVDDGTESAVEEFLLTVNDPLTPPTITPVPALSTAEDVLSATRSFTVADADTPLSSLQVTAISGNTTLIPNGNITLTPGAGGTYTVQVLPAPNQNGSTTVTLRVFDGTTPVTTPLAVTVTPVNDAPTISSISDQTINKNAVAGPISFTIADPDGFTGVIVKATGNNPSLVAPAGIVLGGANGSRNITVTPLTDASGTVTMTVTVDDGTESAVEEFLLTVNDPLTPPTITPVPALSTAEDVLSATRSFTVADADTPLSSLQVTAISGNTTLIPNGNITLTPGAGGTYTVQVLPAPNQNGSTTVTLRVFDGTTPVTTPLAVTVTPVNDLPTITPVLPLTINQNTSTLPLEFTIADIESAPETLSMTRLSGNTTLVPLANIVFGGTGATRTVTVTPVVGQFGTANITIKVNDPNLGSAQTSFLLTVLEVNTAPFFVTTFSNLTIDEDGSTGSVPFQIGDANTPVNSLTVIASSSNAAVVDDGGILVGGAGADRNFTITPNINAYGVTTITMRVRDGTLFSEASFILDVNSVNDLPTITSILPRTIDENTSTGPLEFTVADIETLPAALTLTSLSSNNALADDGNIMVVGMGSTRTVNVIPKINRSGTTTITLTVKDANGGLAQTAFLVNVTAIDAPPTITPLGDITLDEGMTSALIHFTVADIDVPAEDLTVTKSSGTPSVVADAGISLVEGVGGDWTVQITPVANAFGTSLITLTVHDGPEETTTTFTVTVNSINDLPTITAIGPRNINEDESTGPIPFTIGDVETPIASLTIEKASSNTALVPLGNIIVAGSGPGRTVTVTPLANASGSADVTIKVKDADGGEASRIFTVTVAPVNDKPTISPIVAQNITEDQIDGTGDIPFTVNDQEAGVLVVESATSDGTIVPVGNITFGGTGTNRTVKVVPAPNKSGTVTITLTVKDAEEEFASTTFNVVIAPVNDDPTITTPPSQSVNESTPIGPIGFVVGDVETPVNSLTVTRSSSNTTLFPDANVVLGGTGANRNVTATPVNNLSGSTTITLSVNDGSVTISTSFDITVIDVKDPPTITAIDDLTISEDTGTPAIPFTIADPDTPVASLSVSYSSDNQSLVPDASIALGGSGASRTVTVTPVANQNGVATITITVSDGPSDNFVNESFLLTVSPVNDNPTITAIPDQTTNEDTPTGNIGFTVGDLETALTSLDVSASSDNASLVPNTPTNLVLGGSGASRSIRVVPASNASGTAHITVTVKDDAVSVTRVFTVNVAPVNDDPVIGPITDYTVTEETSTGPIPFTISDVETAPDALLLTKNSSNTTLVPEANVTLGGSGNDRTITVVPALNQTGSTTISIIVDDGSKTAVREFVVNVTPVNDSPTISAISNRTINEDTNTGNISFTVSDPETPAASLLVEATSDNPGLTGATIAVTGTGTRTINFTPLANQNGSALITVSVSDGAISATRTFTLNVTPVNDLPQVTGQETITTNEGQPVTLNFTLLHVTDPDNTEAQLTLLPTGGANYSLTGPTTITPNPAYNGPLTVPVLVSDGLGVGSLFNVAITVISTNDAPVVTGQKPIAMDEDQTLTIQLSDFIFTDADPGDTNHTLIVDPGTGYTVSPGNQITPTPNLNGTLTVIVRVYDGTAYSAPYSATVTVNPVNDPPTITGQTTLTMNEEGDFTLLIGHFTVLDLEPTSYTLTVMPPAADAPYILVSGNTIRAKTDVYGVITVPVRANDGQANSPIYDAQVTITPVNDPPIITNQTSLATVEDIPITIKLEDLVVTDVDNPGYPAGFTLNILAGTNYTVIGSTVTSTLDFVGELQVNVQVSDGVANSNVYPLRVTVTDDADAPIIRGQYPVTMNEDTKRKLTTADVDAKDTDTDTNLLVLSILPGTNYTIEGNTDVVVPIPNFAGTLTVNVRVFDGEAYSNTFPLQVAVTQVNDLPSFNTVANISILEDAPQQTITITGISAGPLETLQPMKFTPVSDNTNLIPNPVQAYYNGTAATTTFTFTPALQGSGVATITLTLVDELFGQFQQSFTITVNSVNDAPLLQISPMTKTLPEDSPATGVKITQADPGPGESDQTLSYVVSTDNNELFEIVPRQDGDSVKFKLKENAFGTAHVTVRLTDSGPGSPAPSINFVERTFTIIVTPVNDPPVVVSIPGAIAEPGKEYTYDLVVTDADNDDLTIVASSLPSWLSMVQGENGHATISGVPPQNGPSSIPVIITITDEAGVQVPGGFNLTVDSRPVVSNITITIQEDAPLKFTAGDFDPAGFHDPDGNALAELMILTRPNGTLTSPAGAVGPGTKFARDQISTLTYVPNPDFNGIDTLRWTAADGFGLYPENTKGALLTINVSPVNDVPEFTMEAETDTLKFELGSELPVKLTRLFDCFDKDGDKITGAEIGFKRLDGYQFSEENDRLIFNGYGNITGTYGGGVLTLRGTASTADYDSAIRSVLYNYVDAKEFVLDMRSVYIQISDGQSPSAQHARLIDLIYTFEDLLIPTAFSPNEDTVNDTWEITSPNGEDFYSDAELKVYNKNGLLLYQAHGLKDQWTGIYNGSVLPTDTYYYTIDLHYNKVRYKGAVTLVR